MDDEVVTLLKFADGAIGSLEATRNAYGRNNYITFEIHGRPRARSPSTTSGVTNCRSCSPTIPATRAASVPSTPARRTPTETASGRSPRSALATRETKIVECYDFFNAIVTGKQPSPSFEDGYLTELVADALIESGDSGTWTRVRS